MRKTSLFLVVLAALILAVPLIAWAQGGPNSGECDVVLLTGTTYIEEQMTAVAAAQEAGDYEAVTEALSNVSRSAGSMSATCSGWAWAGNGDDVFGPVTLDEGTYIAEWTATSAAPFGTLIIGFENLDDSEFVGGLPFDAVAEGESIEGRGAVRVDGGTYLIDVTASGLSEDGWTFRLLKP